MFEYNVFLECRLEPGVMGEAQATPVETLVAAQVRLNAYVRKLPKRYLVFETGCYALLHPEEPVDEDDVVRLEVKRREVHEWESVTCLPENI